MGNRAREVTLEHANQLGPSKAITLNKLDDLRVEVRSGTANRRFTPDSPSSAAQTSRAQKKLLSFHPDAIFQPSCTTRHITQDSLERFDRLLYVQSSLLVAVSGREGEGWAEANFHFSSTEEGKSGRGAGLRHVQP